jgi:hypothetical protein
VENEVRMAAGRTEEKAVMMSARELDKRQSTGWPAELKKKDVKMLSDRTVLYNRQ